MAYPRRCPICEAAYSGPGADILHTTPEAAPGGTPSPQFPDLPGRLLTLRCALCTGTYAWDYFASATPRPADGRPRRIPGTRPHPYRADVRRR
jgi:hypothetical protein